MIAATLLPTLLLDTETTAWEVNSVPVWLGYPGRCTGHARRLVFVFDDSGSMTGGNDPVGNRYAEAAHAVATLARSCRCGRERVQVLHFDSGNDSALFQVTDPAAQATLHRPDRVAGSSELGPALRRVRWSSARGTTHLIVLSDFQLLDPDPDRVLAQLARFPGQVTAVVLGAEPDPRLADPRVTVVPIAVDDQPGALARALFAHITTGRPGRALPN